MREPRAELLLLASALALRAFATGLADAAALAQLGAAARGRSRQAPAAAEGKRQRMWNYEDLQYYTRLAVGGQEMSALIDTGSFELVVFERSCSACGAAGGYNRSLSPSHRNGSLTKALYYGSGDVYAREAFDLVSLGPFGGVNLSFWEGYDAYMPVLEQARFQAIVGVGPPETPASDAWGDVRKRIGKLTAELERGVLPGAPARQALDESARFSAEVSRAPKLLRSLGVSMFSLCLGRRPGSGGYFIWDDQSALERGAAFKRIAVMGKHTWTVNLTAVRLGQDAAGAGPPAALGCEAGCGAIVDSGTSLIMMPAAYVDKLVSIVEKLGKNCSNMRDLPDLVFALDGQQFSLPPDSYLAEMTDAEAIPSHMLSLVRMRKLAPRGGKCEVSVMESWSDTAWGPLWIIGMPFFRKYYTTFSTGRSRSERALYVAPATAGCRPASPQVALALDRGREVFRRRFNLSRLYLSPLAKRATGAGFLEL